MCAPMDSRSGIRRKHEITKSEDSKRTEAASGCPLYEGAAAAAKTHVEVRRGRKSDGWARRPREGAARSRRSRPAADGGRGTVATAPPGARARRAGEGAARSRRPRLARASGGRERARASGDGPAKRARATDRPAARSQRRAGRGGRTTARSVVLPLVEAGPPLPGGGR